MSLNLSDNVIGDEGARMLAKSLPDIKKLYMGIVIA